MAHHTKKERRRAVAARAPLLAKAARALELPADITTGAAHLELSGNREAVVDGCRGVLEYDENVIRLNTGAVAVRFCGRGLSIRSLTRDSAVVEGYITSIEFIE
ncbi:MAG: YabP/YqfC family sporulation protein [Clostridia bacterium]|nr:YabP/YqfC family sporulation protein [Clostridia bacterium]